MAEKRYFWLKLPEDFFSNKEILRLESVAGGDTYLKIYLMMLLLSLQEEGKLYYEGIGRSFADELAMVLHQKPENVQMTLNYLDSVGLIREVSEGGYELIQFREMVGSETDSARRMRKSRERKKLENVTKPSLCYTDVTTSDTEIEKEKIKRRDRGREETETDKEEPEAPESAAVAPYSDIVDLYHRICISYPRVRTLSQERTKHIAARWNEYDHDLEIFRELFEKAEASSFLKGCNSRNWSADFNWLMNSDNMAKVLEDKYQDRHYSSKERRDRSTLSWLESIAADAEGAVTDAEVITL